MHLNIQSITNKLDILEIESQPYDVLVFTETWLSQTTSNEDILIPNFNPPFRCDRQNRIGGGVAMYVRDSLYAKQRNDLSINGLESLWIELHIDHRKLLLGGIYRPPHSNNTEWNLLEESIDRAFNQRVDNILVTGDFNIDILKGTPNKINRLTTSYSAEQLITTATHFTEHSSSLIDLMIVKHTNHVLTSFVADPFIPDLIRFHCPIVTVLKFNKPKITAFKRHIWLYDKGDFNKYRELLGNTNWEFISQSNNLDNLATKITENIKKRRFKLHPKQNSDHTTE